MSRVFVAGALHLDVVVDAPHLPALDETVMGHAVAYRFGGKGGNQAVAAARMGASASMAGRVGQDRFGDQILGALDAAGVERSQVRRVPDGASGMSVAIVDAAGDYGAVVVSGVNRGIDPDEIDLPPDTSILVLQNEIPEAVNVALARRAPRVILNAAPARAAAPELLARTDLLVVNRKEAADLTGATPETLEPERAADALAALGPPAVLVTLGPDGMVGVDRGRRLAVPAHRVEVASTHGAGDAFVGALAADLARGAPLEEAARFGAAAAACLVATPPDARGALSEAMARAVLA